MTDEPFQPQVCPRRPMPPPRPYRVVTRYGVEQIINPAVCGICWLPAHDPSAHHAFEPARLVPFLARQMGWTWA